jgi:hypothetical protein
MNLGHIQILIETPSAIWFEVKEQVSAALLAHEVLTQIGSVVMLYIQSC